MSDRLSPAVVGLVFVLSGPVWFAAWGCWESTRTWVPLDVPVSLAPGQIHTPEFPIHVASTYMLGVAVSWPANADYQAVQELLGLDPSAPGASVVAISWRLTSGGRQVAAGHSDSVSGGIDPWTGRVLGVFDAPKGKYILHLDVGRDGSRLTPWAPHLLVYESGGEREDSGTRSRRGAPLILLIPIGVVLLVRAANSRRVAKRDAWMKAWPLTLPGPQSLPGGDLELRPTHVKLHAAMDFPRRRVAPPIRPAFTRPAWFGLVLLLCYIVIDIPVWGLVLGQNFGPKGLPVRLLNPAVTYRRGPGIQPLLVRLVLDGCDPHPEPFKDSRPCVYIGSRPVSWDAFESALKEELRLRPPDWPVYLEGDRNMAWKFPAEAIDKIRGLHAEVILLGSRSRQAQAEH